MRIDNPYSEPFDPALFAGALADLIDKGYKQKFRREPTRLCCIELYRWINPGQFNVDESYYFEEASRPDIDRMLYAITTNDGVKGILVDACDVYADNMSLEMVQKLEVKKERPANNYENGLSSHCNIEKDNEMISNPKLPVIIRQEMLSQ